MCNAIVRSSWICLEICEISVNYTPLPQKRTRLWLAKIHSRVIWNITPPIISHIQYGVGGVKSAGGGGRKRT